MRWGSPELPPGDNRHPVRVGDLVERGTTWSHGNEDGGVCVCTCIYTRASVCVDFFACVRILCDFHITLRIPLTITNLGTRYRHCGACGYFAAICSLILS